MPSRCITLTGTLKKTATRVVAAEEPPAEPPPAAEEPPAPPGPGPGVGAVLCPSVLELPFTPVAWPAPRRRRPPDQPEVVRFPSGDPEHRQGRGQRLTRRLRFEREPARPGLRERQRVHFRGFRPHHQGARGRHGAGSFRGQHGGGGHRRDRFAFRVLPMAFAARVAFLEPEVFSSWRIFSSRISSSGQFFRAPRFFRVSALLRLPRFFCVQRFFAAACCASSASQRFFGCSAAAACSASSAVAALLQRERFFSVAALSPAGALLPQCSAASPAALLQRGAAASCSSCVGSGRGRGWLFRFGFRRGRRRLRFGFGFRRTRRRLRFGFGFRRRRRCRRRRFRGRRGFGDGFFGRWLFRFEDLEQRFSAAATRPWRFGEGGCLLWLFGRRPSAGCCSTGRFRPAFGRRGRSFCRRSRRSFPARGRRADFPALAGGLGGGRRPFGGRPGFARRGPFGARRGGRGAFRTCRRGFAR